MIKKPSRKITVPRSIKFDFDWISKKVSLTYFMDWCNDNVPANAIDMTLELVEVWEYDDCLTYLEIAWKETIINPDYEKQLKKYNKQKKKP